MSAPLVASVLHPFPAHALGWFCLGYNISDVVGRVPMICQLLLRAGVPQNLCSHDTVSTVLQRLLREVPHWICIEASAFATVDPLHWRWQPPSLLATYRMDFVPCSTNHCVCGAALTRWREQDATAFTLARGAVPAKVLFLRCFHCDSVYAGCWRWMHVPLESRGFPNGFHTVYFTGMPQQYVRWFFASGP